MESLFFSIDDSEKKKFADFSANISADTPLFRWELKFMNKFFPKMHCRSEKLLCPEKWY